MSNLKFITVLWMLLLASIVGWVKQSAPINDAASLLAGDISVTPCIDCVEARSNGKAAFLMDKNGAGIPVNKNARHKDILPDIARAPEDCSSVGSISIISINPPEGTILEVGSTYTFDMTVSYDLGTYTSGSIGVLANDSTSYANLDNQTQNGTSVSTQSGTATVSVTTKILLNGQSVSGVNALAALFPGSYSCTTVSDYVNYTTTSSAGFSVTPGYIFEVNDNTLQMPEESINNTGSVTLHYGTITLGGNWLNSGYFSSSSGVVELNNSSRSQSVTTGGASSAFHTLKITNTYTSGVTFTDALYCGTLTAASGVQKLSFGTSGVHAVSSNFNVNGSSGNLITLAPAAASTNWYLDTPSTSVSYLDVSYSHEASGKVIIAQNSTNGGNNENWVFAPDVTTGAATSITTSAATLNGTVNANGTSTTVWFQYSTTSGSYSSTTTTQAISGTSSTSVSASLSGLSSSTTYYYRLAAQNSAGTAYGSETSFTTSSPPSGGGGGGGETTVTYITVSTTTPPSGGTNVAVNTAISATFSDTMNGSTLTTDTFRVTGGGGSVSGSVSTSGNKATFTPSSSLAYNTTYTVTITTGAQAANASKSALASDYSWSFTTTSPTDTTAPAGNITINSDSSYTTTKDVTLNLSATDNTGVTGYSLSTSSTTPSATGTSWVSVTSAASFTKNVSYTLSSGDGSKTIYAFYKDAAGNVSNAASDSIILDTTLPTIISTNPVSGTTTVAVNATISATFSETMDVSAIGTSTFTLSGGITGSVTASTGTNTTATFKPSGNLSYNTMYTATVKKDTKDLAGNLMASDYTWNFTTTPLSSTAAPAGNITINSNAFYTTSKDVTLNLSATDSTGVTGYYISSSPVTPPATGTSWVSVPSAASFTKNVSYTLSSGDGTKTVYAFYKNAPGNMSTAASDSIILDTTAPTITEISPADNATGIDTTTVVTAAFSEAMDIATIGTSTFKLSGGVTGTVTASTGTSTIAAFKPLNALNYNGTYTATITTGVKDMAGNAMASDKSWSFRIKSNPVFDAAAPVGSITINNDAAYTNSTAVTLNLSATDAGGVTGYYISTGSSTPLLTASGWTIASSTANYTGNVAYALSGGDGKKTVYAFYRDAAGNISGATDDSIILDTIPPTVTKTTPAQGAAGVAVNTNVSATFSEVMDVTTIGNSTFTLSGGASGAVTISTGTATTATLSPLNALAYNGSYTAKITTGVKDMAGNALSSDYIWNFNTETRTPIVADFTADPTIGIKPLTVQFTDLSTGNVSNWKWDFGDGNTDATQNPKHTYKNKGDFTVSLAVSGSYGSDTKTIKDYISVKGSKEGTLTAGFTANPTTGEWPLTVQFTDQCMGDTAGWKWDFGDGSTASEKNPSHTYEKSGNYTVTLTASDKNEASSTKTVRDYIAVTRKSSGVSLSLSPSEITFGESLTLSGQIIPANQADVTLTFTHSKGEINTVTVSSDTDGGFSLKDYFPPSGGSRKVSAGWKGNDNYKGAESDSGTFTAAPARVELTILSSSSSIYLTKTADVTGTVTVTPNNETTRKKFMEEELNLLRLTPDGKYEDPLPKHAVLSGDQLQYQFRDVALSDVGTWELWTGLNKDENFIGTNSAHIEVEVREAPKDVAGYAVLVEGRVEGESGLDSHNLITNYIYSKLLERGFTDNDVYYFNFDTSQTGVDEKPSQSGVLGAIKTWASGKMNTLPAPLYLIFAGHGEKGKFPVYPETIKANDLSSALDGKDGLMSRLNTDAAKEPVIIVMGANYSGSFIKDLVSTNTSPASGTSTGSAKRVIITSCDTEEAAYKAPLPPGETTRYGDYFVYEFMKYAARGKTLKKSYELAAGEIAAYTENEDGNGLEGKSAGNGQYFDDAAQHPLLEDNKDGVGTYGALSSLSGKDGETSGSIILGFGTVTTSLELTEVSGVTTLGADDTGLTLYAKVNDSSRVGNAWVEITSPNHTLQNNKKDTEQQVIGLPVFSYNSFDETQNKYTWTDFAGNTNFGNFGTAGEYGIFYFTRDSQSGEIAPFMTSDVFKNSKDNKPPTAFNPIFPVYGTETAVALKFDWEDSTDPDGAEPVTYDLTVSLDEGFSTIYYQQKGLKNSFAVVDKAANLRDEVTYYWKVLASDVDGGTTRMGTATAATNNARILGYVKDADSNLIVSVDISTRMLGTSTENVTTSGDDGFFELKDLGAGRYLMKAEKEFYRRYKDILELEDAETKNIEITMKKLNTGEEGTEYSVFSHGGDGKDRGKGLSITARCGRNQLTTPLSPPSQGGEERGGKETISFRFPPSQGGDQGEVKALPQNKPFQDKITNRKNTQGILGISDSTPGTVTASHFKPKLANGYPGFVKGFIFDKETNGKISKATVAADGTKGSYKTADNGAYFLQMNSGTYTVSADASGYETSAKTVRVDALSTTTENMGLTVATQPAGIYGQVTDKKKGKPLEGVTITVSNKTFTETTTTDSSGNYSMTDLESGEYKLTAAKSSYKSYKKNVKLQTGETKKLNVKMEKK